MIALMARETVGCDTPSRSPITACTMFWRMYIKAARSDPDRPRIGGHSSTPSWRSRASSPSNSSSVARGALHHDDPPLPGSWWAFLLHP